MNSICQALQNLIKEALHSNYSGNVVINLLVTELTLWVAPPKMLS